MKGKINVFGKVGRMLAEEYPDGYHYIEGGQKTFEEEWNLLIDAIRQNNRPARDANGFAIGVCIQRLTDLLNQLPDDVKQRRLVG